ncbi:MAG: hypothetical protein ABIE23_03135 [archaeon]|nr:hypothetical protein [Candidatus Micrarchaeota archaeon]
MPAKRPGPKGRRNQRRNYTLRVVKGPNRKKVVQFEATMNIGGQKVEVRGIDRRKLKGEWPKPEEVSTGSVLAVGNSASLYEKGKRTKRKRK